MKSEIPKPVIIGIVAIAIALLGFFGYRTFAGGGTYSADMQKEDAVSTAPSEGPSRYGEPGGAAIEQPGGAEAAARQAPQ